MQHIDNHMDELFQKAAENYPLKTDSGNFDDLMPFIGGETFITTKAALSKGKRKTVLLLFAFLFTGLTIATTYLITKNNYNKTINNTASVKENPVSPVQNIKIPDANVNITPPVVAEVLTASSGSSASSLYQKNNLGSFTKGKMFTTIISSVADTDEDLERKDYKPGIVKLVDDNASGKIINTEQVNNDNVTPESKKESSEQVEKKKELIVNETKTSDTKDKKNKTRTKPSLYYGIAAGTELNEVKGQPMTKTGVTAGVILGIQFNPKIAIETGVQVSQKKYSSDGKYFKPKAGSMPSNMLVNSLQSTSTLIEIPVAVKYNFSKKKNTLYAKAGVSSYIMTKEANKYQAVVNGQQQEINSTYKNNHSYFASDVRISAGYQHTVGKKLNIRVEPFIQIPLKGIGIGNMPVTSTGLQLVLTRN